MAMNWRRTMAPRPLRDMDVARAPLRNNVGAQTLGAPPWTYSRRHPYGEDRWGLCCASFVPPSLFEQFPRENSGMLLGKGLGAQGTARTKSASSSPRTSTLGPGVRARSTPTTGQATWCEEDRRRSQPQMSPIEKTGPAQS